MDSHLIIFDYFQTSDLNQIYLTKRIIFDRTIVNLISGRLYFPEHDDYKTTLEKLSKDGQKEFRLVKFETYQQISEYIPCVCCCEKCEERDRIKEREEQSNKSLIVNSPSSS
jgi:hypothetical protein